MQRIGCVCRRGSGGLCPWSRGCGPSARPLPLHSTYQEESGTHSPTLPLLVLQGPDSYLKSCLLRPPAYHPPPSRSQLNSSLSLCCSGKNFQTEVNIRWLLSQTGVTPHSWCGCLQGQRPGQASRTERMSLFLVPKLLPCSHFLCFGVGISSFSSLPSIPRCLWA